MDDIKTNQITQPIKVKEDWYGQIRIQCDTNFVTNSHWEHYFTGQFLTWNDRYNNQNRLQMLNLQKSVELETHCIRDSGTIWNMPLAKFLRIVEVYNFDMYLPYRLSLSPSLAQISLLEYFSKDQRRRVDKEIIFNYWMRYQQNLQTVPLPSIIHCYVIDC